MANLTKKQIDTFNKAMETLCSHYGLIVSNEWEGSKTLSTTKNGVYIQVSLEKFDNKYKTTFHTLYCQMHPQDREDQKAKIKVEDAMQNLKGDCTNYKYNHYTDSISGGIKHLAGLLHTWNNL